MKNYHPNKELKKEDDMGYKKQEFQHNIWDL